MNSELNQYIKLVEFLGWTLGDNFEVILQDTTELSNPIIASTNNSISSSEFNSLRAMEILKSEKMKSRDYLCNYPVTTSSGKFMKTSIFFIRNAQNDIIGMLSINMKCDVLLKVQTMLGNILRFNFEDNEENNQIPEISSLRFAEPTLESIKRVVDESGIDPGRMSFDEKIDIICDLYNMGIYNLKGAVAQTSKVLKMSEPSVYRYLTKIRKAHE